MEIVCNYRKCRKQLISEAWVTTCSHAFCVEHGKKEFKRNSRDALICPACQTELGEKYDVVQANLKPCEAFKSIVLAGMKPEIILDVAMRGICFWTYQAQQEVMYHEQQAKRQKESVDQTANMNLQKLRSELESYKHKVMCLQNECNKKRKLAEELTAKLEEKTRKLEKYTNNQQPQQEPRYCPRNCERREPRVNRPRPNLNDCRDCLSICPLAVSPISSFVFQPRKDLDQQKLSSPPTPMFDFRKNKSAKLNTHFDFKPVES